MHNIKEWFAKLTTVGKISVITVILMGGSFVASATNSTSQPIQNDNPATIRDQLQRPVTEFKEVSVEEPIKFDRTTAEDESLALGAQEIRVAGKDGIKTITYTLTLTDGLETSRTVKEVVVSLEPVTEVTAVGTYVKPTPKNSCDPNYSGCVPDVSYDLDCADIGFSVNVIGYDKHGFDRDNDGYGCESY